MSEETQEEGCGQDAMEAFEADVAYFCQRIERETQEDIFAGGPLVFDERIEADVQAAVADLQERQCGQRIADLLALVRPPDSTFSFMESKSACWNRVSDPNCVFLESRIGGIIGLALAEYGTEDYAEILKRFSDPEFRAAHNLDKRPDFVAATRDIARGG